MSKDRFVGISTVVVLIGLLALPVFADGQPNEPLLDQNAQLPQALAEYTSVLAKIELIEFGPLDVDALLLEDESRKTQGLPIRFAVPRPVEITPSTHGTWETLKDGSLLWQFRVICSDALSINLGFTQYNMPAGGRLLIQATDESYAIRTFTADDNKDHGELWTPVVLADDILLELTVPAELKDELELELTAINQGYRFFGEKDDGGPRQGWCNIDVICPEGDDWRDDIQSVAAFQRNGSMACTGFMINNIREDGTPYFMTANHCGVTSSSDSTLVCYWNFHSPNCGDLCCGSLSQNQSGSTYLASYSSSDFTLVLLDDDPDPTWNVTFAGWDRSSNDPTSAVAIHHPGVDEKAISFENQACTTTNYLGSSSPGDGTHIRVADWDLGTTEPGSSGSPLFDQNHRVVGQLHGGYAACGNDEPDWYGRFSVSWSHGLSTYLDPDSTGATTLDTFDPGAANLTLSLPDGAPNILEPEMETPFDVQLIEEGELYVEDSGLLHYRYDGGTWLTSPLVLLGDDLLRATLPGGVCTDSPEFYITVEGDHGSTVSDPPEAPTAVYTARVGTLLVALDDDFETNMGWTVENVGLHDGSWERGVPVGEGLRGDPPTDADGSGACFLTDNVAGNSDVDGGTTYLISPVLDLTAGDHDVNYSLWYTNDFGAAPNDDVFKTWVSNNNGLDWTLVHTIGPESPAYEWFDHSFKVSDFVTPSAEVRVRFEASDLDAGSCVEAGIDAFLVSSFSCDEGCDPDGDLNGVDGCNGEDIQLFLQGLIDGDLPISVSCHGDFNDIPGLDMGDIDGMIAALLD